MSDKKIEDYLHFMPDKKNLSDKELIEVLKEECRLIKIQRNEYEQKLIWANRRINGLESENKHMTSYIDKTTLK